MGREAKIKKERNEHKREVENKIVAAYNKSDIASFLERELDIELYAWQRFIINRVARWRFKRG